MDTPKARSDRARNLAVQIRRGLSLERPERRTMWLEDLVRSELEAAHAAGAAEAASKNT